MERAVRADAELFARPCQIAENRLPVAEEKQVADPSGMEVVYSGGRFAGQDGFNPLLFPQDRRRLPLRRGIS
jgi:hypothetical protein